MHAGKEAIRDWLYKQGHGSWYSPKGRSIKVMTTTGVVLITTMRQAIEFTLNETT